MDYFSEDNLDTQYNDCVSTDLKSLALTEKKLREWIPIFEAQKRIKTTLEMFLKKKAERVRKEAKDDDNETDEDSDGSDSEDEDHEVQVMIPLVLPETRAFLEDKAALTKLEVRSFLFKIWLRRI